MRGLRAARPVAALAVLLATGPAGCRSGDPGPAQLPATTPLASATAGASGPAPGSTPGSTPDSTPGSTAGGTPTVPPTAAAALAAYRLLGYDWQRSRSRFFAAVSAGRSRTPEQQRTLAAAYLAGLRRFAAGLRSGSWPASARPAVRELLAANAQQQAHVAAMARAPGPAAFAARLADYGVDAARENRAVAAVERALGG